MHTDLMACYYKYAGLEMLRVAIGFRRLRVHAQMDSKYIVDLRIGALELGGHGGLVVM